MVYSLALIHDGAIIGRFVNGLLHAHSEVTQPNKKGVAARLPHPLEDPATHSPDDPAQAARGVQLALVGDVTNDDGDTKTVTFATFAGAVAGIAETIAEVAAVA